ncbi:asparagine synthase [Pseudodesulfovibrio mercurii]|uniref:Asparagine synthase n=1 Tax=Pseudodesulfovibrio mercurii TaxID=641491 RepID=F0JIN1_9BACT|nr:ATP-dependent sacrificial sulfur transferase LarE [Pseudodesulfovibrio mercurii]EGB15465.1 asparagine synthase [Pseudodesulfovibrio mercurii]
MSLDHLASLIAARAGDVGCAVTALSGGVDSSLVAAAAHLALGPRAMACTVVSELTPDRDLKRAERVAAHIGIEHRVIQISALVVPEVRRNLDDRCYHCKCLILRTMRDAFGAGCLLLDGTNADDDPNRPGLRALQEFHVYSVLLAAGLGKAEIRGLAREAGLSNWEAPSESCLATRIPTGVPLNADDLGRVNALESYLHTIGVHTVRVRPDNLMATVEYLPQYAEIIQENRDKIVALANRIGLESCTFREWAG